MGKKNTLVTRLRNGKECAGKETQKNSGPGGEATKFGKHTEIYVETWRVLISFGGLFVR